MSKTYTPAVKRREELLQAACDLAEQSHYMKIRRHDLAEAGRTCAGNVSRVFGSMEEMRSALIQWALDQRRYTVVAQAIVDRHPVVENLDKKARLAILRVAA